MPLAQYMFMAFHTVLVGVLEWEASASMRKHRRREHVTNFNYYNGLSPTCFFINNIDAALPVLMSYPIFIELSMTRKTERNWS